jgi:DNA-binding transcriptional MerR regulator
MSETDGMIPTMVPRKQKRGSGFRYSTKKALERSKLSKEKAKDRGLELGSVRKALMYPCNLLSEIGVVDLAKYCTGSFGPASLKSIDENPEERIDASIGNALSVEECSNKVSIS